MKKIFNLENLLYFTILALPAYLIKFSFLGLPTNLFEILAGGAVIWFLIDAKSFKIELGEYKKYFIPIGLIFGGLLLSTVINGAYAMGAGITKGWFIIPIVFAVVAVKKMESKKIFRAIYNGAFLVAGLSLAYFFANKLTFDGRLEGIYNSPNYLAMYLAPAVIIGGMLWSKNKKYYIFSLLTILCALYFTFSYAAWLAILMAMLAGFALEKRIPAKHKILGLVFLIAMLFLSQIGTDKMRSALQMEERSSLSSRAMIWQAAQKITADNPIWGIGPGNFQNRYLEYQKHFPLYLEWAVPHPHNIFWSFWLQAGLVGLVGFVWLLFVWIWEVIREGQKEFQLIGGLVMLYILTHGLVDTTYFKNDLAVIFWLIFFVSIKKSRQ